MENPKYTKNIQKIIATIEIENMHLDEDFINELIKVDKGEKSSEQLRQEVIDKYAR